MRQPAVRAEISRSRITSNFLRLRELLHTALPPESCDLIAVVKGNAYGHGVRLCAPWLAECGAKWLGVTSVEEGIVVRSLCPRSAILVMRCLLAGEADALLEARLTPTVWNEEQLGWLEGAARRRRMGASSVPIHLELDTGMSRQGAMCHFGEIAQVLERLRHTRELRLEAIYTHFASPEVLDAEQNYQQLTRFKEAVRLIVNLGFQPRWIHGGNSSTLLGILMLQPLLQIAQSAHATLLVRPGIALYGYVLPFVPPASDVLPRVKLEPVLSLKSSVASTRVVNAGTRIGYAGTFYAAQRMYLGLLPVGYADGLSRRLSSRGRVLVCGRPAPIVGRISMDLTVVDLSGVPAAGTDEEVVLLGEQSGQRISANDHATWADTIPYEILCAISARVPRIPVD